MISKIFFKTRNKLIRETCQLNWQLFPAWKVRLVNSFLDEICSTESTSFPFCNNNPTKNISHINKIVRKNTISFSSCLVVFCEMFIKFSFKIKLIYKVLFQHWQRFSWIYDTSVREISLWFDENLRRVWQEFDKNLTRLWQEFDKNFRI